MLSFYVLLKFFSGSTAFTLSELLAAVLHEACAAAILISAIFFQRGTTRAVLKLHLARVLSHSHAPHEVGLVGARSPLLSAIALRASARAHVPFLFGRT